MKCILLPFLLLLHFAGHSQQIKLSKSLNETRLGLWTQGDYKVYVELDVIEATFRDTGKGYSNAALNNQYADSVANVNVLTSQRFLIAADQLKKAQHGFDLRTLDVYFGAQMEKTDTMYYDQMQANVMRFMEGGLAVVYFKDVRIYELNRALYFDGEEVMNYTYTIRLYYDDENNYVYQKNQVMGW
jgi:hypothetical protein